MVEFHPCLEVNRKFESTEGGKLLARAVAIVYEQAESEAFHFGLVPTTNY